jgi:aquaporin Z
VVAKSKKASTEVSPGALIAEYVGTFFLAFGVLASLNGVLISFIPTQVVAGFTLFLAVLTIGGISGAHINPGVTIGAVFVKLLSPSKAFAYILAQVAGAFTASAVMLQLLDGALLTSVAGVVEGRIFVAEMIGALFFGFGVGAALFNKYKGVEAAAVVGGSLLIGTMFASVASNGILNPAVAFAVDSVSIVYLLAPVIGISLGMKLYETVLRQK